MPVSAQAHQGVARHPPARRGSGKCAGARSGGSRDLHREVTCTQRCVQRGAGPGGDDVVPTGPATWVACGALAAPAGQRGRQRCHGRRTARANGARARRPGRLKAGELTPSGRLAANPYRPVTHSRIQRWGSVSTRLLPRRRAGWPAWSPPRPSRRSGRGVTRRPRRHREEPPPRQLPPARRTAPPDGPRRRSPSY